MKPRCGPVRVGVANNLRISRFFLSPKVGDFGDYIHLMVGRKFFWLKLKLAFLLNGIM